MRMILKSLHGENFKGIKSIDIKFGEKKTKISGQNASGKTTIFDIFSWLLFNKNSAGEEKFNVRPLDKDGNRIDNVEIKVVAVLDVDGKEVELSKVQKQNWVKKRGTNTVSLQGNPNSYEIDGYPKSEAEFKAYISGLGQSEEMFKMLTNPQYFSSLKWKDQRDILMKLTTEVSDVELAQTDVKYAPLIAELAKAPSTDDIRAKFSKALSEWKKKQAEIPVRIDEAEKSKVDVDVAEQELLKADLERKIEALEDVMAKSDVRIDEMRSEEMHCQFEMSAIAQTMNNELSSKKREIENHKYDHERKLEDVRSSIRKAQDSIESSKKSISEQTLKKADLVKKYNEEVCQFADRIAEITAAMNLLFTRAIAACDQLIQEKGTEKYAYTDEDVNILMTCANLAGAVCTILTVPIMDSQGKIAENGQELIASGVELLTEAQSMCLEAGI